VRPRREGHGGAGSVGTGLYAIIEIGQGRKG
jgi:hypothetical protein